MNLLSKQLDIVGQLDPDRIYLENVRNLLRVPFFLARVICDNAVKEGLLIKRYAVLCPNDSCNRIILSVNDIDKLPKTVSCEICEIDGQNEFTFKSDELRSLVFYQLDDQE